jgi:hypothetical protein
MGRISWSWSCTGFAVARSRGGSHIKATVNQPWPDALTCRAAGLGLAVGPGLLLGLLEPSRGQPVPTLTARLASLYHRR